ncbi:MAG: hypothetical protein ACXW1P_00160 [Methylophilaceae bacterium]
MYSLKTSLGKYILPLIRKSTCALLYAFLLLALTYAIASIAQAIAHQFSPSLLLSFILVFAVVTLTSYLFFRLSQSFRLPLAHPLLRKFSSIVFAVLGLIASVLAALVVILMQRSGLYENVQITLVVSPWLTLIALSMGVIVAGRLLHHHLPSDLLEKPSGLLEK